MEYDDLTTVSTTMLLGSYNLQIFTTATKQYVKDDGPYGTYHFQRGISSSVDN